MFGLGFHLLGSREDNDHVMPGFLNCSGGCERLLSQRENAEWMLVSSALASEPQLDGVSRLCHSTLLSSSTAVEVVARADPVPES